MSGRVTKGSGPLAAPATGAGHQFRISPIEKHVTPHISANMRSTLAIQGFSRLSCKNICARIHLHKRDELKSTEIP